MSLIKRFASDELGTTAIEYALIAAGIFLAIILSAEQLGIMLNDIFVDVAAGFQN